MKIIFEREEGRIPTLQEVDDFPLPVLLIPRVMDDGGHSEEVAKDLVREAKRMLYLKALGAERINPSIIVDDGWHAMLMFTRFYHDFADFIGVFVHHHPTPPGKSTKPAVGGETAYAYTKRIYKELLGIDPDPKYWG